MKIGLLTVLEEDDILPETLPLHEALCDVIYRTDERGVDGLRAGLLDTAYNEHGYDNWFLLLHADEVWRFDPDEAIDTYPDADGFTFRLPCHIPFEPWDDNRGVLEQLRWYLAPGYPEFRMFKGSPEVRYRQEQHFNVTPSGIRNRIDVSEEFLIHHYPWRSHASQQARATATWDPDNYAGLPADGVFTVADLRARLHPPEYVDLRCDR